VMNEEFRARRRAARDRVLLELGELGPVDPVTRAPEVIRLPALETSRRSVTRSTATRSRSSWRRDLAMGVAIHAALAGVALYLFVLVVVVVVGALIGLADALGFLDWRR
jgi:hypothetical protein